jgi:hypothetical protein
MPGRDELRGRDRSDGLCNDDHRKIMPVVRQW